mmetsp:Transcript_24855/g.27840  ORF Transcript_24855/g.27840 Transcript_24855/m.27840 type:complete len:240 (-) Transcript_24855:216-935(-)
MIAMKSRRVQTLSLMAPTMVALFANMLCILLLAGCCCGGTSSTTRKTMKKSSKKQRTVAPTKNDDNTVGSCDELQAFAQKYQDFYSELISREVSEPDPYTCNSDVLIGTGFYTERSVLFTESDQGEADSLAVYRGSDEIREYYDDQCIRINSKYPDGVPGFSQAATFLSFDCAVPDDDHEPSSSTNTVYGTQQIQGFLFDVPFGTPPLSRFTFVITKKDGQYYIVHDHDSVPTRIAALP